jgi:secreted trypsin-like serine protease
MIKTLITATVLAATSVSAYAVPQARIINSYEVGSSRHPSFARLHQVGYTNHCGATFVSPLHAVTAAHCVSGSESYELTFPSSGERVKVVNQIIHTGYSMHTMQNDIAILVLDHNPEGIDPSSVVNEKELRDLTKLSTSATVVGYGATEFGGDMSPTLREVSIPLMTNPYCNSSHIYDGHIMDNMVCAGYEPNGQIQADSCQGDSGGPIFAPNGKLIGVVSWGVGCGTLPGVYQRVGWHLSNFLNGYGIDHNETHHDVMDREAPQLGTNDPQTHAGSIGFVSLILLPLIRRFRKSSK